MKKYLYIAIALLMSYNAHAQELQAVVTVNTQQVNLSNRSAFKTLEKALAEFINQTRWTTLKVQDNERIRCNFTLVINKFEGTHYDATLLVQASRPVYNTAYQSPTVNLQDKEVSFDYQEYTPLAFNESAFESNLTSVIAYYAYLIIGYDAASFAEMGGEPYFEKAKNVVTQAQSSSYSGWRDDGKANRWQLTNELLSENYRNYHKAWYTYHRLGLDTMSIDEKAAKGVIQSAVVSLEQIPSLRLTSYAMNLFCNAKTDELVSLFSGGAILDSKPLKEALMKLAPNQVTKWNEIK